MANINKLIGEGKLEEAAAIVYNGLRAFINTYIPGISLTNAEFDFIAPALVAKMQNPAASAKEPSENPGDDVTVSSSKAYLNVEFSGPEGDEDFRAPDIVSKIYNIGATYTYNVPSVAGYTADPAVITGTMVADGVDEKVTYTKKEPASEETPGTGENPGTGDDPAEDPGTANPPEVRYSIPEGIVAMEPVEFSITTVPGDKAGTPVVGTSEGDLSNVELFEYWEPKDSSWKTLTGLQFGPASGFPLMEATSKFRVTFKDAGTTTVTIMIKAVDGGAVLAKTTMKFVCAPATGAIEEEEV